LHHACELRPIAKIAARARSLALLSAVQFSHFRKTSSLGCFLSLSSVGISFAKANVRVCKLDDTRQWLNRT